VRAKQEVFVAIALSSLLVFLLISPLLLRARIDSRYEASIYRAVEDLPFAPVALVLGAGYSPSGRLSTALADRMETAITLYQTGKVNKLLLSGDNQTEDYNEPAAMAEYARARGVPREDLVLDFAGRRTYDSCFRADAIFGVERVVVVTQAFHLPRSLYTCDQLGLVAVGIVADRHRYMGSAWYELRELAALLRAWLDLNLIKPLPVLGEPIDVDWNQRAGSASGG
jgi:SanA protein